GRVARLWRRWRIAKTVYEKKGGPLGVEPPCPGPAVPTALLAGELLPLDVHPELLRHLGRADRLVAEDGGHRVVAALEVDRVASERLLALRHSFPSVCCE